MNETRAQRLSALVLVVIGLAVTALYAFGVIPQDGTTDSGSMCGPLAAAIGVGVLYHLRPTAKGRAARRRR